MMDRDRGRSSTLRTSRYTALRQRNGRRYVMAFVGIVVIIVIVVIVVLAVSLSKKDPYNCFPHATVAADAERCSEIGRDMLKRDGSAVDAAIATLLCVGLFNAHSMGLGGGVVFTIYNASTGKVEIIDAKEIAPMKASVDMFDKDPESGGLSIAVPGELRGYEEAHKRHGRLEWKELFEPSIKLAREGIKIGRYLAKAIEEKKDMIQNNETWCEVFCDSNNKTLKERDTIKFLKLAKTYELIATGGPDVFYNGSLSQNIVNEFKAAGGIITSEDLQRYKPRVHDYALNFTVGKYIFHAPNAPFGGPVLAMILKILNGYNISSSSMQTTESKILTYHRIIEAFRFAYAEKSKLGDPQYVDVTNIIKKMTSDKFAEDIRSKIDDTTTNPDSYYELDSSPSKDFGTSHLSIIAEDGSAVGVTSSINEYFGSMVMSPSTGIIFNNQIRDFSFPEKGKKLNKNNLIEPGKKPLSSMTPTIILDEHKRVRMVVGASGGTQIITATALVILNQLFFDYSLRKSVDEPRIHNGWEPNVTYVEHAFDKLVLDGLQQKNHIIQNNTSTGKVQAAVHQGDQMCGGSDPRKGGYPAGY